MLLRHCSSRMTTEGSVEPLDDASRQVILDANASFAQDALRVLGIARRSLEQEPSEFYEKELERDLIFLGLAHPSAAL